MTAGSLTAPARSAPVQQKSPQICGLFTIARDFPRAAATAARSGPDPPLRSRVIDDRVVGTRVRFLPLDKHILVVLCEPGDVAARVGAVARTQRARSVAGESPVVQYRILQCEYVHLMPPLQRAMNAILRFDAFGGNQTPSHSVVGAPLSCTATGAYVSAPSRELSAPRPAA